MQRGKGVRRVPGGVPWGTMPLGLWHRRDVCTEVRKHPQSRAHRMEMCWNREALGMVFALIWQRTEQGYLEQEWGPLNPVGHSGWALASLGTGRGLCSVDLRHCQCGPRAIHGASLLANVQPSSLFLIREPVYGSYSVLSLGVAERILL